MRLCLKNRSIKCSRVFAVTVSFNLTLTLSLSITSGSPLSGERCGQEDGKTQRNPLADVGFLWGARKKRSKKKRHFTVSSQAFPLFFKGM